MPPIPSRAGQCVCVEAFSLTAAGQSRTRDRNWTALSGSLLAPKLASRAQQDGSIRASNQAPEVMTACLTRGASARQSPGPTLNLGWRDEHRDIAMEAKADSA